MTAGKSREPVCSAAENWSAGPCVCRGHRASVLKVNHSCQFQKRGSSELYFIPTGTPGADA